MSGPAAGTLTSVLQKGLADHAATATIIPPLGAFVGNACGEIAHVAVGSYPRRGASSQTPVVNPPNVRWSWASISKTLTGVVMQMLMANESLPQVSWNDKLHQWVPVAIGTAWENASLLDVASHTACFSGTDAPFSQDLWDECLQQFQLGGIPAARAVDIKNSLRYSQLHPPFSNCIPELNTETTYSNVAINILALVEETISGVDFGTLTKSLIFDPLGMSSAEVKDANPAGGLWATVSDLYLYGRWLMQGYYNHPDAIAKTLMKHQDFVDLMSPIKKQGVQPLFGRTFTIEKWFGRPVIGHGGCSGAWFYVWPEDNLVIAMADFPEDAAWAGNNGGNFCETFKSFGDVGLIWQSVPPAFLACSEKAYHLCNATPVDGSSLTCHISETFNLDSTTLDVPYKISTCREEDLGDEIKEVLSTYLAIDHWGKAFVLPDSCQWATFFYMLDPCESIRETFKICAQNNAECGVYLVGNHSYNPSDLPCRCGTSVPRGSCSLSQQPSCSIGGTTEPVTVNTSCLISGTGVVSTTGMSSSDPSGTNGSNGLPSGCPSIAIHRIVYATWALLIILMYADS